MKSTLGETQAHYGLAQALERQGKKDAARQELEVVLKANPNFQPARELMVKLTATEEPIEPENGVKTVGYEERVPIAESRLAPNAKLLSQPGSSQPEKQPTPQPDKKPAPAASMQPPEPIPVGTNPPRPLPPMMYSSGWE